MKKHILIAKLFEFGGSNTHFKTLVKYFGDENIVLLVEDKNQLFYLNGIEAAAALTIKIKANLHEYANLKHRFSSNIKELFYIIRSILSIQILSMRHGFADITISAVEPEKYLYLLWVPFSKVNYILHTAPHPGYTPFTSYTCNTRLGKRKKIITVSNANKTLLCKNWDISDNKSAFVYVIHNCVFETIDNLPGTLNKNNDQQFIVTLGHVIGYKNPSIWLETAKLVTALRTNINFIWVGDGPLFDEFKNKTQNMAAIIFNGAVADPENYLKDAIIYYQPSLHETHGIAVVEAMSNSLPCVVSNVGGLPESVQQNYNGFLVDASDINEHVKALITLIDDPELRSRYGLNGYTRFKQLFPFDEFKAAMDKIYLN